MTARSERVPGSRALAVATPANPRTSTEIIATRAASRREDRITMRQTYQALNGLRRRDASCGLTARVANQPRYVAAIVSRHGFTATAAVAIHSSGAQGRDEPFCVERLVATRASRQRMRSRCPQRRTSPLTAPGRVRSGSERDLAWGRRDWPVGPESRLACASAMLCPTGRTPSPARGTCRCSCRSTARLALLGGPADQGRLSEVGGLPKSPGGCLRLSR